MVRRRKKRVFIIKIPPMARGDIDKFIERLSKALAGDPVLIRYREGYLRVEVFGGEVLAKRTREGIKRVLGEFKARREVGASRVSRKTLYREAGVAIPLDVLEVVLNVRGYEARIIEDEIVSSAPLDEILASARIIGEYLREAENLYATKTAKKLVLAVESLTGSTHLEVIDKGMETGIIEEDDEGKLYVLGDWREAVKKLVHILGKQGSERIVEDKGPED